MTTIDNEDAPAVPGDQPNRVQLLTRVRAEYREMPGLALSEAQAQRLWSLDATVVRGLLDELVQQGELRQLNDRRFVRATEAP